MSRSVLAGIYLTFAAYASSLMPDRLTAGIVFSFGLCLIVLTGSTLFTGCMLRAGDNGWQKLWLSSYIGNFVGCLAIVVLLCLSGVDLSYMAQSAHIKSNLTSCEAFLRGAGCNVLVCTAVYLSWRQGARNTPAKILCCILPVTLFIVCGFEHSVADMSILTVGVLHGVDILASLKTLVTVTAGNVIGGIVIWWILAKN